MLFRARGDADYTIHLTYPIDDIDKGRKEDWEKEQRKEKKKKLKKTTRKSPALIGLWKRTAFVPSSTHMPDCKIK